MTDIAAAAEFAARSPFEAQALDDLFSRIMRKIFTVTDLACSTNANSIATRVRVLIDERKTTFSHAEP